MEMLIYTYLLLSTLSVLVYFLYSMFTATKIANSSKKQLITTQITDNQSKFHKSPIQLHLCPIHQVTSESTFDE
jgi:hypothetical protein